MNCENYPILIEELIEDELDAQSAREVTLHIFGCPECESQYEMLKREKETYAHYLFDVEPSSDLLMKFQEKLKSEKEGISDVVQTSARAPVWLTSIFGLLRSSTGLASAVLLFAFGIGLGLLKFIPDETLRQNESATETNLNAIQAAVGGLVENETTNLRTKNEGDKNTAAPKDSKNFSKKIFAVGKNAADTDVKFVAVKSKEIRKKIIPANEKEELANNTRLSEEEQLQRRQAGNLEKEAVKQIEQIELLLRSFRNARAGEGNESFDIEYEKNQARKLLDKNVLLRQNAENYGGLYTQEILGKAELFLLDIANLENSPSTEKVLSIKNRVKNQNIIASLQIYK